MNTRLSIRRAAGLIERGFDFELMRHLAVVMEKVLKACNNDALYKKSQ